MNTDPGRCSDGAKAAMETTAGRSVAAMPVPRVHVPQWLKVLRVLQDAGPLIGATTMEIIQRAQTCKPNNRINDCRREGYQIDMTETRINGKRVCRFYYRGRQAEGAQ